jgi:hypothetical protein
LAQNAILDPSGAQDGEPLALVPPLLLVRCCWFVPSVFIVQISGQNSSQIGLRWNAIEATCGFQAGS